MRAGRAALAAGGLAEQAADAVSTVLRVLPGQRPAQRPEPAASWCSLLLSDWRKCDMASSLWGAKWGANMHRHVTTPGRIRHHGYSRDQVFSHAGPRPATIRTPSHSYSAASAAANDRLCGVRWVH